MRTRILLYITKVFSLLSTVSAIWMHFEHLITLTIRGDTAYPMWEPMPLSFRCRSAGRSSSSADFIMAQSRA